MLRKSLEAFATRELPRDDHVVIEATGNASSVVAVLEPFVDRAIVANPKQVRMIAHAKIKTDAIDAAVLAKLYATGFLPEVWTPDQRTLALRRQVSHRTQFVRQRVRLKNPIQSILQAHLAPPCQHGNLVGISGRKWITRQSTARDFPAKPQEFFVFPLRPGYDCRGIYFGSPAYFSYIIHKD